MTRRFSPAIASAGSLLLLAGCVTSTQATRLQTDLDEVKRQIFQVQQETAASRSQIEEVARAMSSQTGSPASAQADLQASVQSVLDQIQVLSEKITEVGTRVASLSDQVRSLAEAGRRSTGAPDGSSMTPPAASLGRPSGAEGDKSFQTAYADYSKGNYELALMGFTDFLKRYPGDPRAAEAHYWIGECLYSQGKFGEAAEELGQMVERYPNAEKAAPALLKRGYAQIEAGRTSQAVGTLQKLIEAHPRSDEAKLASERLKSLGLRARQE